LQLDVFAAGTVVPPVQMQDAVHTGLLDGCHAAACASRPRR
jgi:TRAP-type mannitol/chloroaromatic compound transport system substrate-binding protein